MIYPRLSIATYLKIADSSASNPFAFALFGYYRAKKNLPKSSRLDRCKSYIENTEYGLFSGLTPLHWKSLLN